MILQCPKCFTEFWISDFSEHLKQTCQLENCKTVLDIRKLVRDEVRKISIYELSVVKAVREDYGD